MVAYNFKKQFAEAVSSGEKRQTIRAPRKSRHAFVHEKIQLYTGMRTKRCRKLIDPDPRCQSATRIRITQEGASLFAEAYLDEPGHWVDLPESDCNGIAIADGFDSFEGLKKFFQKVHGLPFEGVLIKW